MGYCALALKKDIHYKWVFKRKAGLSPNESPRFNGRLVAKVSTRF
jgi:hypothetical protein